MVDGWAQVYERPCWSQICHFPSRVWNTTMYLRVSVERLRASIHAPGDFCVLQVQVDRDTGENHQKIFFCLHYARSWTQIYLQAITWFWNLKSVPCVENQELLLSMHKWSHGSAKIQSLYRVSTIRPLLASQHETRVQFGIPTKRRSNSEGTPWVGKGRRTFNDRWWRAHVMGISLT